MYDLIQAKVWYVNLQFICRLYRYYMSISAHYLMGKDELDIFMGLGLKDGLLHRSKVMFGM